MIDRRRTHLEEIEVGGRREQDILKQTLTLPTTAKIVIYTLALAGVFYTSRMSTASDIAADRVSIATLTEAVKGLKTSIADLKTGQIETNKLMTTLIIDRGYDPEKVLSSK